SCYEPDIYRLDPCARDRKPDLSYLLTQANEIVSLAEATGSTREVDNMGLFSRKKVAKRLDLTPARVSQMATSGALIAPIEDEDGTERGWPGTYVEEVAARRQGRQTSRSIY